MNCSTRGIAVFPPPIDVSSSLARNLRGGAAGAVAHRDGVLVRSSDAILTDSGVLAFCLDALSPNQISHWLSLAFNSPTHLSPLVDRLPWQACYFPRVDRPKIVIVGQASSGSANHAARHDVAVMVPIVCRPRDGDPRSAQARQEAGEKLKRANAFFKD
jgi:hypothetical protein